MKKEPKQSTDQVQDEAPRLEELRFGKLLATRTGLRAGAIVPCTAGPYRGRSANPCGN
jgi:hypothetical protein